MVPRILIVDDSAPNRETMCMLLDEQGYTLDQATNGQSALTQAAAQPPDLILLDVMMPGIDGYEVCRRLRADSDLAEIPVIMVTALDDSASRLTGIEAGADDFITKPLHRQELCARVRTVTRLNRYRRLAQTRAELRNSELRFQKLAEHSKEVFWFCNLAPPSVIYVSPSVENIWGRPTAEFYADFQAFTKYLHPDDQSRVRAAHTAVVMGEAPRFEEEYRVVHTDGTERWVLDSGTPILDETGNLTGFGGVARDITERKLASEQLLRAQRVESLGMLSAGIAHDFNNALAPVLAAATLLHDYMTDDDGHEMLDVIAKGTRRSADLVSQLLAFTRGSNGVWETTKILPVIAELVSLARTSFPKVIQIRTELDDDLPPIHANITQIHQVFLNLLINARDAMPMGGDLTISATTRQIDAPTAATIEGARAGDYLLVEVSDTGTGVPPEVASRIWEPFFTTKAEGKGTGLGLSTVRGILESHRGFATLHSEAGEGTRFSIYLPVAAPADSPPLPLTVEEDATLPLGSEA